jgi:hypothetical protein
MRAIAVVGWLGTTRMARGTPSDLSADLGSSGATLILRTLAQGLKR